MWSELLSSHHHIGRPDSNLISSRCCCRRTTRGREVGASRERGVSKGAEQRRARALERAVKRRGEVRVPWHVQEAAASPGLIGRRGFVVLVQIECREAREGGSGSDSGEEGMAGVGSLSPFLGVVIVLGAIFVALDPLSLSPIANEKGFKVLPVPQPSLEYLATIPRDEKNTLKNGEIVYGGQIFGPESVLFDSQGRGPYSGVGDGRVVRWEGPEKGWVEFATVVPNRTEICYPTNPPSANVKYEHLCGRPLGIRFNKAGELYICDAYFGLLKVGPEGGLAELVTNEAEGQKMVFGNDLDIDDDGTIYFTDSSSKYPRSKFFHSILEAEETGRLLKYDSKTKETTVLIKKLRFPNGVTFSKDHSFLVVAETRIGRLIRYWVKGPKAGSWEDFVWLPGYPDNVRTTKDGDFWVALHCRRIAFDRFMNNFPAIKQAFLKLPISMKVLYSLFSGKAHATALKYSPEGKLLQIVEDLKGETVKLISEVEEHDGKLWFGSVLLPHVAVIDKP